jgi:hypothetical protein
MRSSLSSRFFFRGSSALMNACIPALNSAQICTISFSSTEMNEPLLTPCGDGHNQPTCRFGEGDTENMLTVEA